MAATRRRKSKKCLSCRKLKIKCDLGRPACEYCVATGRDCIYDDILDASSHKERKVVDMLERGMGVVSLFNLGGGTVAGTVAGTGTRVEDTRSKDEFDNTTCSHGHLIRPIVTTNTSSDSLNGSTSDLNGLSDTNLIDNDISKLFGDSGLATHLSSVFDETDFDFEEPELEITTWSYINSLTDPDQIQEQEQEQGEGEVGQWGGQITEEERETLDTIHSPTMTSLNSMSNHLQISHFEHRLLKFFNGYYLEERMGNNQFTTSLRTQVPYLWNKSPFLRETVYNLSCMYLYSFCDIQELMSDEIDYQLVTNPQLIYFKTFTTTSPQDLKDMKSHLYHKSLEYFHKCLQQSQDQTQSVSDQQRSVKTQDEALGVILSSVFLYSFLIVQPFQVVPMISFTGQPDIVSFCKGMKYVLGPAFKILDKKNELLIFYSLPPPQERHISHSFPLINALYEDLESIYDSNKITKRDHDLYLIELQTMEASLNLTMEKNNASALFRCLFLMHDESYELMYKREWFASRLLFYYCCLCFFGGLKFAAQRSVLLEFVDAFKNYNIQKYGRWLHKIDRDMYELVSEHHYSFPFDDFRCVETFDPGVVLREMNEWSRMG